MNNALEFVLLLILIVFGFKLLRTYLEQRHERATDAKSDELVGQIEALEKRIRVLERIITSDPAGDLKEQFRDLEES